MYGVSSEGTGANLTGGQFEGVFAYKASGGAAGAVQPTGRCKLPADLLCSPVNLPRPPALADACTRARLAGWDAVTLLWREGSNRTLDYGVLTMPLGSASVINSSSTSSIRKDVRYEGGSG